MKKNFGLLLLVAIITFNSERVNAQPSNASLSFGVVPQQAASQLFKIWSPLLSEVSKQTRIKIEFKTAPNINLFESKLLKKEYDLSYMNPYHYVVFSKIGYQAYAKQANKRIIGIMVAHKDTPINELSDLAGQTLGFPSPNAFAASILTRATLKKLNIPFEAKFVGSHDSVYRNISSKRLIAGGGIERTFKAVPAKVRDQLRIIWKSRGFTPHAFAIDGNIEKAKVEKIANAFASLHKTAKGRELLKPLKFEAIEHAQDSDWNDVRDLGIDPSRLIKNK